MLKKVWEKIFSTYLLMEYTLSGNKTFALKFSYEFNPLILINSTSEKFSYGYTQKNVLRNTYKDVHYSLDDIPTLRNHSTPKLESFLSWGKNNSYKSIAVINLLFTVSLTKPF